MAALIDRSRDRRAEHRVAADHLRWRANAVLRPGQPVVLVNINSRAALVESDARLRPGAHTELQLLDGPSIQSSPPADSASLKAGGDRTIIRGHLDRCHVAALEPLRYRGVLIFDHRLALDESTGREE